MNVSNWKKMYPQHDNIESNKHKEYIKMVNEVSGGATETEDEKNFKKIIHKVAVETVLDKDDKDMGNDIKTTSAKRVEETFRITYTGHCMNFLGSHFLQYFVFY